MKKLSRIAALLAAGALLFGAAGCSGGGSGSGDGDGDGSGGGGSGGGGGSTVSENTVKGTYTVKDADLAGETLVFVGGKIYMRMDYSLGEEGESSGGSSAPDSTTQSNGKYTLTYESGETAHEPSYTFDKVGGDEFVADFMAAIGAGKTSYTFYLEVGTYAIANGKVTGTIIDDEDSYPVTAETDDAGHLKSFTGSSGGGESEGPLTFPLSMKPTTEGSTPAYPTADLDKNAEFKFTSPVSYTVCTKKKFDSGKYNTGTDLVTADRWNLGGALESSGKYNCYMKFDSAPSEKMTVKFFNTNVDRTITVVSGTDKTVGTVKTTKTDGTNGDLMSETFTVTKGSEVYLGATASGIWVTEIVWEE